VIKYPLDLGARKIGVQYKACFPLERILITPFLEIVADIGGTPALPDNGIVDRLPRLFVPKDCGLTLVCYAYGEIDVSSTSLRTHASSIVSCTLLYISRGCVLPIRASVYLGEFLIRAPHYVALIVEYVDPASVVPWSMAMIYSFFIVPPKPTYGDEYT